MTYRAIRADRPFGTEWKTPTAAGSARRRNTAEKGSLILKTFFILGPPS